MDYLELVYSAGRLCSGKGCWGRGWVGGKGGAAPTEQGRYDFRMGLRELPLDTPTADGNDQHKCVYI